jgi:enterochelin esterase-like enzyme
MLEPQSTFLFILLVAIFAALVWWLVATTRLAFRLVAACLAFVIAMSFGVLAVNRYFSYYQTWGAAVDDFTNSVSTGAQVPTNSLLNAGATPPAHGDLAQPDVDLQLALTEGATLTANIRGKLSHISRVAYVYLPPQYFQPQYKTYRFPVIELIHGQPGLPQDWINVAGVQVALDNLLREQRAKPVVLVMPNANGGENISLQCLNQVGGPQDLTYLALDVPEFISHKLRVQPPGVGWGVAGYSEGGYCAANMAIRYRRRYGFAASLSGYFAPMKNELQNPFRMVNPFGGNKALTRENTPLDEVSTLKAGAVLPQFWLGAGQADRADVANAEYFRQLLELRQADVPLVLTAGGGHTMTTWRDEIPPMLTWMTNGLQQAVAHQQLKLRQKKLAAQRLAKARDHDKIPGKPTATSKP